MLRIISAVFAAALAAALFVVLTAVAPQVNAAAPREEPAAGQPFVDGDSAPVRAVGAACSQRAWPYFTRDCLLEPNATAGDIRLIALDRVDTQLPLVTSDRVVSQ
jgi:hypothetical protein